MKKLFLFIAIPLAIVVLAIAALMLMVNPNQFKPLIADQVRNQTGLELVIDGDIGWQFFPSLGFQLGETRLNNPSGFTNPDLFTVKQVGVSVSVMPLLDKRLEIGSVVFDGAQVYIETLKNGESNLDALTKASTQTEATSQQTTSNESASQPADETQAAQEWSIALSGVTVSNALLDIRNQQTGASTQLFDVGLTVSEFVADQWTTANFQAKGKSNEQSFAATGSAEFKLSQNFVEYDLRNIEFNASYADAGNTIESAQITLESFVFDTVNAMTYQVSGSSPDMDFNAKGSLGLTINKAITLAKVDALQLEATLEGTSLPQSPTDIAMSSDLSFDLDKSFLDFVLHKLTVNQIELDGKATVQLAEIPKIRFALHSPNIDVDALNASSAQASTSSPASDTDGSQSESKPENTSPPAQNQEVEPDLSALKNLDIKGIISIDKFKAANAHMQKVKADFYVNRGVAELTSFSSQLYGGSISAKAKLNANTSPATYSAVKRIKGVKVQPLLIDVMDNDKLEGTGNIDVDVSGKSLTTTGIKNNLVGTVKINFLDGAVNGINIAQMIRDTYAKIQGQRVSASSEPKKTDFSAMRATLKLNKGIVSTNDMKAESPLLRIEGSGSANYLNETVDFLVRTSVVGTLEGQGGKQITELRDVTIPIKVTGQWADPKFALIFDDVLKQKAKKEVERATERLGIKDEKTKKAVDGLLKGLFN